MDENTMKLLEKLATKLGTTSEYLWSVLIKQASVSATTQLIQTIFVMLFGIVLYRVHVYLGKKRFPEKYEETLYEKYEETAILPMGVGAVLFIVTLLCCFMCFDNIVNGYLNPEYWALKEVIDSLK